MANTIRDTLKQIHNADSSTINFVEEWHNELPYIMAKTSGSTGKPKEIRLLKKDVAQSATATCSFFNINSNSTLVSPLSSNYIAGKMMIVRAIISGAKLWIEQPSNNPLQQDYGSIDLLPIVPSQVDWLINECKYTHTIRNLIIGGGVLSKQREDGITRLNLNAYATYGMTETCSHIALRKLPNDIYQTLPGISITQDDRKCLKVEATQFSFKELTTNDIIEIIDSTHFKWVGRYDNVINSGGVKIYPEDIERKLSEIISQPFFIIGSPDEKWGECVTLYVENGNENHKKLIEYCRNTLDKYSVPKRIICVKQFERTESGKIIRKHY